MILRNIVVSKNLRKTALASGSHSTIYCAILDKNSTSVPYSKEDINLIKEMDERSLKAFETLGTHIKRFACVLDNSSCFLGSEFPGYQ